MRNYRSGKWGFTLIWGLRASVFPQAFVLALPNAIIAWFLSDARRPTDHDEEVAKNAVLLQAAFTSVLFWVLYFRSTVAYNRWWEGGTLLQQTRGEWFNAYSSLIAFSSTDPKMAHAVEAYHHQLARFMSLLFCSALQQVSPDPERPFEVLDGTGLDPESLQFLSQSSDRVEVILQWIQRSTIINMSTGILPIPPPVMSRAFQEISRGIVNLQNARKIADFPFPFPYAQTSIVMLLVHWAISPIISSLMLNKWMAAGTSFASIFFLWCMNYTALQLESPFGKEANDLPMDQMQSDWNKSVGTLLANRAQYPPTFQFDAQMHRRLNLRMSDGSQSLKKRMTVGRLLEGPHSAINSTNSSAVGRSVSTVDFREEAAKSIQLGTVVLDRSVSNGLEMFGGSPGFGSERGIRHYHHGNISEASQQPVSPQWQPLPSSSFPKVLVNGHEPGDLLADHSGSISEHANGRRGGPPGSSDGDVGKDNVSDGGDGKHQLAPAKPLPSNSREASDRSSSKDAAPGRANRPREWMQEVFVDDERSPSWSSTACAQHQVTQERQALTHTGDKGTGSEGTAHPTGSRGPGPQPAAAARARRGGGVAGGTTNIDV